MRFKYCPDCGALLTSRDLGDDKDVPWCADCDKPWFDMFSTCIIALVHDGHGNVLVQRQAYTSTQYGNLVSGYMTPGETAEDCARREIHEETGLTVKRLDTVRSYWFARKGLLMLGFIAEVEREPLHLSQEVDDAQWYPAEEALMQVHQTPGSTSNALCRYFIENYAH